MVQIIQISQLMLWWVHESQLEMVILHFAKVTKLLFFTFEKVFKVLC